MAYNLLNYEGIQADTAIRNPYFRKIMQSVKPDLLVCEEIVAYSGIQGFVANVMNDSADIYALGTFITGFDTNKGLIYRKEKFTFVSNHAIHTDLRDINEFTIIHKASGDTLRLYAVHLKASSSNSDEDQRALEVDSLRKRTNALPAGSDFIVCGDFNIYNTNEEAYEKLLQNNAGDDGNVNDPIGISGVFNNASYAKYHTQSPRVRSFGGGVTGGMDDRFDMMLFSNAMMQPGGITYVAGSTIPFGNDGNHYNDSINRPPNTAVGQEMADALHNASDHLPLIAKIEFQTTGIDAFQPVAFDVEVFPNPFVQEIEFVFSGVPSSTIHFELFDLLGRKMDQQEFAPQKSIHYNSPALSGGIYFYRIATMGIVMQGKLVKV
ncbi:MAG TPA: T9SS type A sorting domain-containing protein [Chitinophagales bacterium]|nr:T9SS type A sorting domain-containing protein [Chitinophagales bacterium]